MPATFWQQLKELFTPVAGMARSYDVGYYEVGYALNKGASSYKIFN